MDVIPFTRKDVLLNGWLVTRGPSRLPFRPWRPYWCVLAGDQIYYFRLAGSIPLKGCKLLSRTSHDPEEPLGFVLELHPVKSKLVRDESLENCRRHGKPYPLCSPKQAELDLWEREVRKVRGGIFGQSLEDTITNESESTTRSIPVIVEVCVEYLRKNGMKEEGLFRLNGRNGTVQGLQDEFDKGEIPDFEQRNSSVHTVASLLKRYFTLLPEPIIPWRHCRYFIPAMQRLHEKETDGQKQLMMQLALLPRVNYNLLKYLCEFLHDVHRHQIYNKMGLGNLANIFAPHILRPEHAEGQFLLGSTALSLQLVYYLIQNHDIIFPPFSVLHSQVSYRPQELINHDRLGKESMIRASLQDLPLPKETEVRLRNNVMNIHLPDENNYSNEKAIERNNSQSGEVDKYNNRIYENVDLQLPRSSPSAGSITEAIRTRIPPKPKPRTDQKAKRYGVSYKDPANIISNVEMGPRSFSNASTAIKSSNLSDDSKELGILFRGKKHKWQKGDVQSQIISTYQNMEVGSQPLALLKDPKVNILNLKNNKNVQNFRETKSVAAKRAIFASTSHDYMKKSTESISPIPVPRRLQKLSQDENCNDKYEVTLPLEENLNEDIQGTVQGLHGKLKLKEEELSQQQKLTEKLRKDLENLRNRLSVEAIARQQAEAENELLQEQLERLRHRLGSL